MIENGFTATSVDQVIAESATSKGSFFHHFDSKHALARALVERYVAADIAQLDQGIAQVEGIADPIRRLIALLRIFEDGADTLMGEQSSCLYVAVLSERQLAQAGTADQIVLAIEAWRCTLSRMITEAVDAGPRLRVLDPDALADHVFVTFEGAFLLCRSTGDPGHMRRQLRVLRMLVDSLLTQPVPAA